MRLFTIDGGNTNLSIGVHFENQPFEVLDFESFEKRFPIHSTDRKETNTIYSSVKTYPQVSNKNFPLLKEVPKFEGDHFFEMPVHYGKTIGMDRLVGSLYCFEKILHDDIQNIAFIDAGTFITIDLINKKGLQGGYIFPGMKLLAETYSNGEQLLLPKQTLSPIDRQTIAPQSTEAAIQQAYNTLVQSMFDCTKNCHLVITGGDAKEILNIYPHAEFHPNLIHLALLHIAHKINL